MTIKSVITIVLQKILRITVYKIHYLKLDIDPSIVKNRINGLTIRPQELNLEDFLLGDKNMFNENKLELYKNRFNSGKYRAYGLVVDNKLVYSSWISLYKIGLPIEPRHPNLLKNDEGYFEDDYCMPEFRGKGIHTQMIWFRLNELLKMGRKTAVITIMDGNNAALKPALKCGFRDMGVFYNGKIWGMIINMIDAF